MIFHNKTTLSFSPKTVNKRFDKFTFGRESGGFYIEDSVGFELKDGVLMGAKGTDYIGGSLTLSVKPERLYSYKFRLADLSEEEKLFAYGEDGHLYIYIEEYGFHKTDVIFDGAPYGFYYRTTDGVDKYVFSGSPYTYFYDGEEDSFEMVRGAPASSLGAFHYERLFVKEIGKDHKLTFSKALEPFDWSDGTQEGGYIEMPDGYGKILHALSFNDKLYLLRERGITRLTAMGDNLNFQALRMDVACGNILDKGACVCGNYIVFLSDDGIYRFDGKDAEKFCGKLFENIDTQSLKGCFYYGGIYYLALKNKLGEARILKMDVQEESGCFLIEDAECFINYGSSLICADGSGNFYELGKTEAYTRLNAEITFNSNGAVKVLKRLVIDGAGVFTVKLKSDYGERGAHFLNEMRWEPCLRGERFYLQIEGRGLNIYSLEAVCYEY